ncbi:hypothetical protein B0T26DRAFT_655642 [Lasiosphaeria miniovina]|uniref:Uncharacterized protein n=1 Tax=Lasiosphaeria miniovina TaxID=1954250 RepID=A0AA39ZZ06_9PEZI|nr:uncharacterized protein B0T26DRAFT_655642 [Lasiosphaeria miniovina]KAK0706170.1 hypothetical protein B0T26DRAFT_655642 [Lasiosphaeria miniovina]
MCRHIIFSGQCTQCHEHFTWREFSQELSCLEAKNAGVFGLCRRGIMEDEQQFDLECAMCEAAMERDGSNPDTEDGQEGAQKIQPAAEAETSGKTNDKTDAKTDAKTERKQAVSDAEKDGRQHKKRRTS